MNRSRTAFVFPGQGSQVVGMGKDIATAYPTAEATFQQANDILGFDLAQLCFEGPQTELDDTINTQPALYVTGVATLRALQSALPGAVPAFVAGHSLGEFTALTAAGALAFEDGVKLVRERGRLMKHAGEQNPGAMAALLGVDLESAQNICTRASAATNGDTVVVANDNCPGQLVISGHSNGIDAALDMAKSAGAKRAVRLAVSIAAHSPLMEVIAEEFRQYVDDIPLAAPQIPIFGNVEAARLHDVADIRQELRQQLTHMVRWTKSARMMIAAGADHFLELGPGDVLTKLFKRIDRDVRATPIKDVAALQAFISANSQ